MKYLFLLATVAIVYFVLARNTAVNSVKEAVIQSDPAPLTTGPREPAAPAATNSLKAPLDRTHAVLEQVKQRNGAGEF